MYGIHEYNNNFSLHTMITAYKANELITAEVTTNIHLDRLNPRTLARIINSYKRGYSSESIHGKIGFVMDVLESHFNTVALPKLNGYGVCIPTTICHKEVDTWFQIQTGLLGIPYNKSVLGYTDKFEFWLDHNTLSKGHLQSFNRNIIRNLLPTLPTIIKPPVWDEIIEALENKIVIPQIESYDPTEKHNKVLVERAAAMEHYRSRDLYITL